MANKRSNTERQYSRAAVESNSVDSTNALVAAGYESWGRAGAADGTNIESGRRNDEGGGGNDEAVGGVDEAVGGGGGNAEATVGGIAEAGGGNEAAGGGGNADDGAP